LVYYSRGVVKVLCWESGYLKQLEGVGLPQIGKFWIVAADENGQELGP
jgi:hypothetical protein